MTKRQVTDKIRQKVVETFRISGDDESRKGRPIYGYFTFRKPRPDLLSLLSRSSGVGQMLWKGELPGGGPSCLEKR